MRYLTKTLLVIVLLFGFMVSNAQNITKKEEKEARKAEKEKLKKEAAEKEAAQWLVYQKLAEDKEFVVEISKLGNRLVSKRLNFLYSHGNRVVIQFETNAYSSENGLGGRTIDGTISNYNYTPPKNENKPIYINFDITSTFNQKNYNITITVYSGGTALISFGGGISNVKGFFMSRKEANINTGVDMRN